MNVLSPSRSHPAAGALTAEQEQQFLERGHLILTDCFSRETAEAWKRRAYERLGYDPDDPGSWVQGRIHMPGETTVEVKEFAPRAWEGICALMGGEERVSQPCHWSDGFIVNFHDGADRPWESPQERREDWHIDGDWFRHFLDGPEQGLLVIVVWSDIRHQGGGTFIACDSVAPVAHFLAGHPEGVLPYGIPRRELLAPCRDRIEITGNVGDVVLLHPFILHSSSQNKSGQPRFITNPAISFREPMNLHRTDPAAYSLVERAILRGLGVEQLDFRITSKRQYLNPADVHREEQERRARQ